MAQFCFLSFVGNIMFSEDWIKVAGGCSHFFAFCSDQPWQLQERALLNDSVVSRTFANLFPLCVSLTAYRVLGQRTVPLGKCGCICCDS